MPYCVLPAQPCTISMQARRVRGAAAVLRSGVCAGTIASRNGIAMVAPMPRRTVRRERWVFVMNMEVDAPYRSSIVVATSSAFLIWKGTLFTMPSTNEKREKPRIRKIIEVTSG